jgi:hypothetical protein
VVHFREPFRLSCTVGLRVFVCENLAFHGEYTPVLAKHSKHFSLEDSLAIGVDRMQRNFEPLKQQVVAAHLKARFFDHTPVQD